MAANLSFLLDTMYLLDLKGVNIKMSLPSTMAHNVILIMQLASLITGEARGLPAEGQQAIAHVAMNRLEAGYGWNGWYGWGDPSPESIANAYQVVHRDHDPTGGALYALSHNDMQNLGFDRGEAIVIENPDNGQTLYLLHEWQEGGQYE